MRFLPLVAGTAAASAVAIRSTSDNIKCTDSLYVLVGRGTTEPAGPGSAGVLADKIAGKIKGTVVGSVDYPASWSDPNYAVSETEGAAAVSSEMTKYNAACPKAKIAYIGYSQGAQIGSDAFCGANVQLFGNVTAFNSDFVTNNVVAAVLFGDPSHNITAPFNKGTSTRNGLFPREDFSKCAKYTDRLVSYCDEGDSYCASGSDTAVHGEYITKYGDDFVKYIVDHYNAAAGTTSNSGNGSTITGPSNSTTGVSKPTPSATGNNNGKPTGSGTPADKSAAAGIQAKIGYAAIPAAMAVAALFL